MSSSPNDINHFNVAIVGTGFSGLGMAIRLKRSGEESFVLFEKEAEIGGTWTVNHYPGCACDVPSYLYSFSFEPNAEWTRLFAPQREIKEYLARCAKKYHLLDKTRLNTTVVSMVWDGEQSFWKITDAEGQVITANSLVLGLGALSKPSYPEIEGLESFKGKTFHSQQWDHDFDLNNKKVAVIGTGASAIQFVPQIQPQVEQLDLYQRTPPWITFKPDRKVSGRERSLFRKLPSLQKFVRGLIYSLLELRGVGFTVSPIFMSVIRWDAMRTLKKQVVDPLLRKQVTPDYTIGCKRILISNDYYPALAQPNLNLITSSIKRIKESSIVTDDGKEHQTDAIIFGTGFQATQLVSKGMIYGVDGIDITDAWSEGIEAYKGTTVSGFPNMFVLMGPNTGLGHSSMIYMIESQIAYVLDAFKLMKNQRLKSIDVRAHHQYRYNEKLQEKMKGTVWTSGGCRSWYIDPDSGKNVTLWPDVTWRFRRETKTFDSAAYHLESATISVET